nr:centrosomal protein of 63 kDa-like [Lytechinus pictus]
MCFRHGSSTCSESGKPVWYSRALSPYEEQNPNLSTFSYGSLEAYGGDELNQSANIFEELEELRSERLKLSETNEALHRRLKTTEESETELLKKAEEAKKTISSLLQKQIVFKDQMLDLQDEVRSLENNSLSLQNQVASLEAEKQALMKTVRQMKSEDTEKLSLRKTIASLEDELEKAQIEIESKDTKVSLYIHNEVYSILLDPTMHVQLNDVVQHRDELIDKVIEENKHYIELYKSHKDLQSAFQAVQIEKGDMEQSEVRPMTSSIDERLIDKNENLLSELRIVVNDSPGPSPICGRISFAGEMMEGFQAVVESMSAEMESLVASQQNQIDHEQIEQV